MAVLVTNASSVTQTRSSITGPVTGLIVVQTAGGFGPNPGHPGFATVVAGACGVGGSR